MHNSSSFTRFAILLACLAVGCGATPAKGAASSTPCAATPDDGLDALNDEQLVRKLLEVSGAGDLGMQVGNAMMDSFRKMPNLPPGFIDRFKQNLHVDDLIALIVPIYLKHYDRKTLIAMIRFDQSEPGRAMIKALPTVTAESMEAGKTWGGLLAKKTLKDLGIAPPP